MKILDRIFNEYNLKARVFPAIISAVPFLILKYLFFDKYFKISLNQIIFGDISILVVLIYLLAQVDRFVSKIFFETKSDFSTDHMLMPSSKKISDEYRKNMANKISRDFKLNLPNLADEKSDIENTKIRIREIVKAIIAKVKDGDLSLQHSIEYGFIRNLIGGCAVASVVSIINIILLKTAFPDQKLFITSLILLLIYLIPLVFHKKTLSHYDNAYAEKLFSEYLHLEKK